MSYVITKTLSYDGGHLRYLIDTKHLVKDQPCKTTHSLVCCQII